MELEKFCEDLLDGDNRSVVVSKLVKELVQEVNKEEILASWWNERDTSLFYYIVTDKRFFEIQRRL